MTQSPKNIVAAICLVLAGLGACLPALPLLAFGSYYNTDWFHHLWPTGYIANYFKVHREFAPVSTASDLALYPVQVFYGSMLYPLTGFLGSLLGAEGGLRAVCAGVFLLQAGLVYAAVARISRSVVWAGVSSLLVSWAIYPMTSLYNRAAVPEFVGSTFMSCALAAWYLLISAESRRQVATGTLLTGLSLGFALGTHPVIGLYSVPFLGVLYASTLTLVLALPSQRRRDVFMGIALVPVTAALLAMPFFYSAVVYSGELGARGLFALVYHPEHIDSFFQRFSPLAFDKRSMLKGTQIDTPYLDTQANVALLLLCGLAWALVFRFGRKKRLGEVSGGNSAAFVAAALFIVMSWLSLSVKPYSLLPEVFKSVQFPYRLISFVNAALLAILLALLWGGAMPRAQKKRCMPGLEPIALAMIATLGFCACFTKLMHVGAVRASKTAMGLKASPDFLQLPRDFPPTNYAHRSFAPLADAERRQQMAFEVGKGDRYGELSPAVVELSAPVWVSTNVAAFPWNQLRVDGKLVPADRLKSLDGRLVAHLNAGAHVLRAETQPDRAWLLLRANSFAIFVVAVTGLFLLLIFSRNHWGRR